MNCFQARLDSFAKPKRVKKSSGAFANVKWPHPSSWTVTPQSLAEAGFYWSPSWDDKDNVVCFMCEKELSEWDQDDDPFETHFEKCKSKCAWAVVRCGLPRDFDEHGTFISEDPSRHPTHKSMEKARLETFKSVGNYPHDDTKNHGASSKRMARAGFVYTPQSEGDDTVTCFYCQTSLSGWDEGDDPVEEHRKRVASTPCPFFPVMSTPAATKHRRATSRITKASVAAEGSPPPPSIEEKPPTKKKTKKTAATAASADEEAAPAPAPAPKTRGSSRPPSRAQLSKSTSRKLTTDTSSDPVAKSLARKASVRSTGTTKSSRMAVESSHEESGEESEREPPPPPPPKQTKVSKSKKAPVVSSSTRSDDEVEEVAPPPASAPKAKKGKGKASRSAAPAAKPAPAPVKVEEPDSEVEVEAVATPADDSDDIPDNDKKEEEEEEDEEEEEQPPPPPKRTSRAKPGLKPKAKPSRSNAAESKVRRPPSPEPEPEAPMAVDDHDEGDADGDRDHEEEEEEEGVDEEDENKNGQHPASPMPVKEATPLPVVASPPPPPSPSPQKSKKPVPAKVKPPPVAKVVRPASREGSPMKEDDDLSPRSPSPMPLPRRTAAFPPHVRVSGIETIPDPFADDAPAPAPTHGKAAATTEDALDDTDDNPLRGVDKSMTIEQWIRLEISTQHDDMRSEGLKRIALFQKKAAEIRRKIEQL